MRRREISFKTGHIGPSVRILENRGKKQAAKLVMMNEVECHPKDFFFSFPEERVEYALY